MRYWKCFTCDSKAHHKGLCRACTEYDDKGNILKPAPRERVDSQGTRWVVEKNRPQDNYDMQVLKNKFLDQRRKKLTKKQTALLEKQIKQLAKDKKIAESEVGDDGIFEIGEGVGEEE